MSDQRPTPETDAEEFQIYREDVTGCAEALNYVTSELARNLERQRDEAREELGRLRVENDHKWQALYDLEKVTELARELRDALDNILYHSSQFVGPGVASAKALLAKAEEVLG